MYVKQEFLLIIASINLIWTITIKQKLYLNLIIS